MKKSLSRSEYVYIASMLFGMFFGAGNLIFPVYMGQMAGRNMWPALIGFIITGVGLPLLGVAALGISRSSGLFELSSHIGRPYGYFFTCALYLTIGPFFAIPPAQRPLSLSVSSRSSRRARISSRCTCCCSRWPSSSRRCCSRSTPAR